MYGATIKIKWEEQLVDPPIHYIDIFAVFNNEDLQALILVGPTWENLVPSP